MGERLPCKQEVSGSIPLISTNSASPRNKFEAQRSGFKFERRSKEASAVFAEGGNEAERTLRRRGPIAQLVRAHD